MDTRLLISALTDVETELLAVFAADAANGKDAKPEVRLLARDDAPRRAAQAVLESGEFRAESNETLLLHAPAGLKAKRLLLVGLGKAAKATIHEVRRAAGTAIRFAKPRGIREIAIVVPEAARNAHPVHDGAADRGGAPKLDAKLTMRALVEGALVADFDPDTYRSDRKDRSVQTLQIIAGAEIEPGAAKAGLREGVIVGEAQNLARSLVNEPGNRLTPTILGQKAAEMCREFGVACEVHSTEKLRELKMGAFRSVAQGSEEPPALIVMQYEPTGVIGGPVLGLVGKGITFDTGGISIKPADNMEKMKYDMAGGAAMIGAMRAIAQLQPKVRVIGIVCAAENMPSGKAQKPGDVQIAMPAGPDRPGKSIEIINTDAEGRLVLADGLTYAKLLGATHLIDAATLTGAVSVALGMINGGVFSNDDAAYAEFAEALKISGERFWRLPVEDDYRELIRSQIADIKNTGGRYGGAITAAMFLKEFAEETPWVHLDIAAVAWLDEAKPWIAAGPSGVAMRSILEWVRRYAG